MTTCSPETEEAQNGFQAIELDMLEDVEDGAPIVEGAPAPVNDYQIRKEALVEKICRQCISVPNLYYVWQEQPTNIAFDPDKIDEVTGGAIAGMAQELSVFIDEVPWLLEQLEKIMAFNDRFGKTTEVCAAIVQLFLLDMKMRHEAEKAKAKKEENSEEEAQEPIDNDSPDRRHCTPVAGVDPEQGIIDEPDE